MGLLGTGVLALAGAAAMWGQCGELPPELKAKADARAQQLAAWGKDPAIVAAVRAFNTAPPPGAKSMTAETWKSLSLLDPAVRSLAKNPLAMHVKSLKDPAMSEIFISGADGTKVAFITKPSNWSHKGKEKHELPMKGHIWVGPLEVDESSGAQQFQISVPVLDNGRPIGSIVVGLKAAAL